MAKWLDGQMAELGGRKPVKSKRPVPGGAGRLLGGFGVKWRPKGPAI
jgi:hypothetical protein